MICPNCEHNDLKVIDSRPSPDETAINRRRECKRCKTRFTTTERIMYQERGKLPKGRPANGAAAIELVPVCAPVEKPVEPVKAAQPVIDNRAEKRRALNDFMARYKEAHRTAGAR